MRRKRTRPTVPPRENALVFALLLNVLWLAFALGGVRLWGELTALLIALATLFLLPEWKTGEIHGASKPLFRLLKLPLFWLGFGLILVFYIQSWNLGWEWRIREGRPVLAAVDPSVSWLPAGIVAPLEDSNPFRMMIFYITPWLACCCAWVGLSTRRSVNRLVNGLAAVGVLFGGLALYQHFKGKDLILGLFPTVPTKVNADIPFWGTLINENHAAFFLIIATGLCLGLFLTGWHRDLRLFKHRGGSWLLYLGMALMTTFSVLMAQARGAIGFVALLWFIFIVILSVFFVWRFGLKGLAFPGVFAAIAIAIVITFIVNPDVYERQEKEWIRTFNTVENPQLEARYYMMQIAADMIADKPWYGHGAGSWRYTHLPYLKNYPEFKTEQVRWLPNPFTGKNERRKVTLWYENAHVDLMEYVVEWGIIGCLFPVMAGLWLLYRGIRAHSGWDMGTLTMLMTVLVVFLGALAEFHFRIPLVLLVWCLLFTLTIKTAELNTHR
ncbi:MAG: O-antigen ligase family protein [Puniceicoccaceae bacterium]